MWRLGTLFSETPPSWMDGSDPTRHLTPVTYGARRSRDPSQPVFCFRKLVPFLFEHRSLTPVFCWYVVRADAMMNPRPRPIPRVTDTTHFPFGNLLCMCVTDYVVGVCHIAGCRNSGERASRAGTDTPTKRASERLIGSELPNEGRIQTKVSDGGLLVPN